MRTTYEQVRSRRGKGTKSSEPTRPRTNLEKRKIKDVGDMDRVVEIVLRKATARRDAWLTGARNTNGCGSTRAISYIFTGAREAQRGKS